MNGELYGRTPFHSILFFLLWPVFKSRYTGRKCNNHIGRIGQGEATAVPTPSSTPPTKHFARYPADMEALRGWYGRAHQLSGRAIKDADPTNQQNLRELLGLDG